MAWGANAQAQLGDGTQTDRLSPVFVLTGSGVRLQGVSAIAAGYEHSLASTITGELSVWGVQPGPASDRGPILNATAVAPPQPKKTAKRTKRGGDGNICRKLLVVCQLPPIKQSGKCPFTQIDPFALGQAILQSIQQGQFAPVDAPITEAAFRTQAQMRWGRKYFGKWHVEQKDRHQWGPAPPSPPQDDSNPRFRSAQALGLANGTWTKGRDPGTFYFLLLLSVQWEPMRAVRRIWQGP